MSAKEDDIRCEEVDGFELVLKQEVDAALATPTKHPDAAVAKQPETGDAYDLEWPETIRSIWRVEVSAVHPCSSPSAPGSMGSTGMTGANGPCSFRDCPSPGWARRGTKMIHVGPLNIGTVRDEGRIRAYLSQCVLLPDPPSRRSNVNQSRVREALTKTDAGLLYISFDVDVESRATEDAVRAGILAVADLQFYRA